jgi:hypothetical protein
MNTNKIIRIITAIMIPLIIVGALMAEKLN